MYRLWKRALPSGLRRRLMIGWYDRLARLDAASDLPFLNHGYAPEPGTPPRPLDPSDEPNRYWIQLYDQLAAHAVWAGRDALEVSSGHGGGVDWLARAYRPATICGLDIAAGAVAHARARFARPGVCFKQGDAQAMPFAAAAFDIVINVESSLNYPDFAAFLREADRVLKPGGHLLIADYRSRAKRAGFEGPLLALGYRMLWQADLTAGVLRGHAATRDRKEALIRAHAPWPLRGLARRFADLAEDGTASGQARFRDGRRVYLGYALMKPPAHRG